MVPAVTTEEQSLRRDLSHASLRLSFLHLYSDFFHLVAVHLYAVRIYVLCFSSLFKQPNISSTKTNSESKIQSTVVKFFQAIG